MPIGGRAQCSCGRATLGAHAQPLRLVSAHALPSSLPGDSPIDHSAQKPLRSARAQVGRVDIGASLELLSQYPTEREYLMPPLSCLEVARLGSAPPARRVRGLLPPPGRRGRLLPSRGAPAPSPHLSAWLEGRCGGPGKFAENRPWRAAARASDGADGLRGRAGDGGAAAGPRRGRQGGGGHPHARQRQPQGERAAVALKAHAMPRSPAWSTASA